MINAKSFNAHALFGDSVLYGGGIMTLSFLCGAIFVTLRVIGRFSAKGCSMVSADVKDSVGLVFLPGFVTVSVDIRFLDVGFCIAW